MVKRGCQNKIKGTFPDVYKGEDDDSGVKEEDFGGIMD